MIAGLRVSALNFHHFTLALVVPCHLDNNDPLHRKQWPWPGETQFGPAPL